MKTVTINCGYCGKPSCKPTGQVNRAGKMGAALYCDRTCAGLGRRTWKTLEQKKAEKRDYDKVYRSENLEKLKESKKAYFKKTYDPVKASIERKKRMAQHIEYCRQPAYRAKKKEYDQLYRAKKIYGDFGEAFVALLNLEQEVESRASWNDIRQQNGILNKKQTRRRDYERTHR